MLKYFSKSIMTKLCQLPTKEERVSCLSVHWRQTRNRDCIECRISYARRQHSSKVWWKENHEPIFSS